MTTTKNSSTWKFWPYMGVVVGLGLSLAANVAAARLNGAHPGWVEIAAAGVPPLAVFGSIETITRTPWDNSRAAKIVKWSILAVAVPAAIVSYIHLVHLVVNGHGDFHADPTTWIVGLLTPFMIDGWLVVSTGALLVAKRKVEAVVDTDKDAELNRLSSLLEDQVAEIARMDALLAEKDVPPVPQPVITAPRPTRAIGDPLRDRWDAEGRTWDLDRVQKELTAAGRNGDLRPAREVLRRWTAWAAKEGN